VRVAGAPSPGWRKTRAGLAAIFVLAVIACVIYGSSWLTLWIYVSAARRARGVGRRLHDQ
jgi:hypothetical protein